MKSSVIGKNISKTEVLNISPNGIWIIVKESEYFLPYDEFPWFKNAKISEIFDMKLLHDYHLYWPKLDVDLELDTLKHLEQYPLSYKSNKNK